MPLEVSDFPEEVQEAFFMYSFLEDNWDGMSGSYMGKVWSSLDTYLRIYPVSNESVVVFFMKQIEYLIVRYRAEESNKKRKASEKRSAGGEGKNYTHNVRG